MSSIARPFSTSSFCHFFHFFCLPSLVFLAPIYANMLWNCFRRGKSCWDVGMPGMRPEWRQIELQPHPSVSRLIDCAIEAKATEREREWKGERQRREFISPPKVDTVGRPFSVVFLYPCRGYTYFGQKFARQLRRNFNICEVYIF